jgi:MFS family permease
MGASGLYALATIIVNEMVTTEKWGNYVAVTSLVFVLSSVLGPVLGGIISSHSTWRWVFLLK